MENKEAFSILILCGLLSLSGCSGSNAPMQYEVGESSIEKPEETTSSEIIYEIEPIEETLSIEEEPVQAAEAINEDTEQWKSRIYVTVDEMQGNILGYSLRRMPPNPEKNMYYEQDMPYLLDEDVVGKGLYISDYMCETEVFIGDILKEVLAERGNVSEENRQYFTEYALQQLADTDWNALDGEWTPSPYTYDRTYCVNPVYGGGGYRFYYYFYTGQEKTAKKETNKIDVVLYVDMEGKIREIDTDISIVPMQNNRAEKWIVLDGLFDDTYSEQVILNGSPCKEEMVWDFERYYSRFMDPGEVYEQDNKGVLESGNVCISAEKLADIFFHVMENRGTDVEKYEEWFGYDDFMDFADTDWETLGEDWIADRGYDCYFIDKIYFFGYAGFCFYFYPDFKIMDVDTAKMVVINCYIDTTYGLVNYNSVDIFPITEEEYQGMKRNQEEGRILVVEKGVALLKRTKAAIPVIDRQVDYMPISEFDPDTIAVDHSSRKAKEEIWGFTDAAEVSDHLGKKFLQDFDEGNVAEGEIYKLAKDKDILYSVLFSIAQFIDAGWKASGEYDCYYVKTNEAEGCMHLQYYFYPEKVSEGQTKGKTLVIDVYLSESGIEHMVVNEICADIDIEVKAEAIYKSDKGV